jgi:drug/metabolite transporter (DMT)-like permease
MSRKGLLLFLACGVAWGIPYFFIRIAVQQFDVASVILARVVIGALVLIPIAIKQNAIRPALKNFKWVLLFALIEMVGPWYLITASEKVISSGLAGLLVSTVPFWSVPIAYFFMGDKSVIHPKTIVGLVVGFAGVALLVGIDTVLGDLNWAGVIPVLLASVGYAIAPAMASKKMKDVPTSGVVALSMVIVSVVYAVPGGMGFSSAIATADWTGWTALLVLGVVCSAVAFWLFFELIREIGSARATLITYPNTAIAIVIGILFLSEPLTPGMILGFPMVLIGSYFASKKH